SDSVHPGKGPQFYASERSNAVKQYLTSHDIPPDWIRTTTSREKPATRPIDTAANAQSKASARSATIEIGESENLARAIHQRGLDDRFGDHPQISPAKPDGRFRPLGAPANLL